MSDDQISKILSHLGKQDDEIDRLQDVMETQGDLLKDQAIVLKSVSGIADQLLAHHTREQERIQFAKEQREANERFWDKWFSRLLVVATILTSIGGIEWLLNYVYPHVTGPLK